MLKSVKQNILIILCKLNYFYPNLLGIRFWYYKNFFLKKNRRRYNCEKKLLEVVNNAIKTVPYYKEKYEHVNSLNDFKKQLKFIDKQTVMENWNSFLSPDVKKFNTVTGTTGGTSGKPLKLVIPKGRYVFELGTMYTMWKNVGWQGHTRAILRNNKLKPEVNFKVNPIKKELIFDGFRTSEGYYDFIYKTMVSHRIAYLHAYPSSAYQFAVFLKKNNYDTSIFKAFLCGSEALLPEQEALIVNELGIRVYHWYGHSEKLALGGYCRGSDFIHIEPTYGYVELMDEKGEIINTPNRIGEIVGTTLHNNFMPLIRYKTGDFAEYVGDFCKDCNRHVMLLKNIQGRWDTNRIYYKDKTYTSITALNMHDDLYSYINGMQYIQNKPGELVVKIIKDHSYTSVIEKRFFNFFESVLGENCNFEIMYVDVIENEKNGKFLPLKQNVKFK